MAGPTGAGVGGYVAVGYQADKDTVPTAFNKFRVTGFTDAIDWVESESEEEVGGDLDEATPTRYGHQGVMITGEGRARVGNGCGVISLFGMRDEAGGIRLWDGVNDDIRVTDDGGSVTIGLIGAPSSPFVEGGYLTPEEFGAGLATILNADTTLSGSDYDCDWDEGTQKFTISVSTGTATLSLLWTTSEVTEMLADLLGYDYSADDSGSLSYTSDEARDYAGKWWFDKLNSIIRVTDDGGGPVDVDLLSEENGDGAVLCQWIPYNGWGVCAGIVAALNGDTTLTQTYYAYFDPSTNKFTIGNGGTTLTLGFDHANNEIDLYIGFTATAHSGSTEYTSDNAILPAEKHCFVTITNIDDFPYGAFYNMFNTGSFVKLSEAVRLNSLEFDAGDRAPVRWTWSGRGLNRKDPPGGETINDEISGNLVEPHTGAGTIRFYAQGAQPAAYRIGTFNITLGWEEQIEPEQGSISPYNFSAGRRSASGRLLIYLGAEDSAGLQRAVDYGSTTGTEPSTTIVVREIDIEYQAGQVVPNQVGWTDPYSIRFLFPECHLRTIDEDRSGLEKATVELGLTRGTNEYMIAVVNGAGYRAYEYVATS